MCVAIDEYSRSIKTKKVEVNMKYKMVDKKLKPIAIPLPGDNWQRMKEVSWDPSLQDPRGIRHAFTKETREKLCVGKDEFLLPKEEVTFREMLERHGKAFAFYPNEIGCANPKKLESMVIFTIPHVSWNLKPIPVPRAHIPELIKLLK